MLAVLFQKPNSFLSKAAEGRTLTIQIGKALSFEFFWKSMRRMVSSLFSRTSRLAQVNTEISSGIVHHFGSISK